MAIKGLQFALIQGMNQDISPSKRTDKLAYEIKNMRVTVEDNNTLLSWSNEKGTKLINDFKDYFTGQSVLLEGKVLGTCTINDELILFIKNGSEDTILGIVDIDSNPKIVTYYKGDLHFQEGTSFETLAVIENEKTHKIYWIDGVNQARFINVANKTALNEGNTVYGDSNTQFDFLPQDALYRLEFEGIKILEILKVEIDKIYQVGLFKAGTILYAFNYYNKNGAQTNIVYMSPIQYISSENKGNETDDTVNCNFKIKCLYVNQSFDYLRVYSISRTSTDTTPLVRIVTDLPTKDAVFENIDISSYNNSGGGRRAPAQLETLYKVTYNPWTYPGEDGTLLRFSFDMGKMPQGVELFTNYKDTEKTIKDSVELQTDIFYTRDNLSNYLTGEGPSDWTSLVNDMLVYQGCVYFASGNRDCCMHVIKIYSSSKDSYTYSIEATNNGVICKRALVSIEDYSSLQPSTEDDKSIKIPVLLFVDNGIIGTAFDYNALIFMNNNPIIPNTMDLKDNTLFIGNYKYSENKDFELKKAIEDSGLKASSLIKFVNVPLSVDAANLYYPYTNQTIYSADKIMGFKGGESYIFGFIVLDMYDRWSSIIAFKDEVYNNVYPKVDETSTTIINADINKKYFTYIVQAALNDTIENRYGMSPYRKLLQVINSVGQYKAIKFVIVLKNTALRNVVCQGILSPTVFSQENRIKHEIPFAQSSWFFRPMMRYNPGNYKTTDNSKVLEFRHYNLIGNEIQSTNMIYNLYSDSDERELEERIIRQGNGYFEKTAGYTAPIDISNVSAGTVIYRGNVLYGVDNQILTMHSPDIEFDSTVQKMLDDNNVLKFRIIGYTKVHSTYSDADVTLKRRSFFYEFTYDDNYYPRIGQVVMDLNKLKNTYSQEVPAAGLLNYLGALGPTYISYTYNEAKEDLMTLKPITVGPITNSGFYNIFPWNRSTTINALPTPTLSSSSESLKNYNTISDDDWQLPVAKKQMSNLRVCCKTRLGEKYIWRPVTAIEENTEKTGIGSIKMWYNTDRLAKIKDKSEPWGSEFTYEGYIDTVLNIPPERYYYVGAYNVKGEISKGNEIIRCNDLIRMKYMSSPHAVFNLGFNRFKKNGQYKYQQWTLPYIKENLKTGEKDDYNINVTINTSWPEGGSQTVSWDTSKTSESTDVTSYRTDINVFNILDSPDSDDIYNNYFNKLFTEEGRLAAARYCLNHISNITYVQNNKGDINVYILLIVSLNELDNKEYYYKILHYVRGYDADYVYKETCEDVTTRDELLSCGEIFLYNGKYYIRKDYSVIRLLSIEEFSPLQEGTSLGDNIYASKNYSIDAEDDGIFYIGEFYQDSKMSTEDFELLNYTWQVASDSIAINNSTNLPYLFGDTYFQRYDCLKTYCINNEDVNQIVDIGSFMLETRINIDGRYDRNKGLLSNLNMNASNFNLINKAYTLSDKFVTAYISNSNLDITNYNSSIMWSLTKVYGEEIDNWTHLTGTSNLDIDGNRGSLTKIINFQDTLVIFQTDGVGYIKYNENVALAASNGVPVELANSGKVDGIQYLNRNIGSLNKHTIVVTKTSLYFIDGHTNAIYQVNEPRGLVNPYGITNNSFDVFMKELDTLNAKSFYNKEKQEVYFTFYNNTEAETITFNETVGERGGFTSFYSYKPLFLENIGEKAYHILNNNEQPTIWCQNAGDYNSFYDELLPYYITIAANGLDGITDKIWNNIEYRADCFDNGVLIPDETFDTLSVWNEYQLGIEKLNLLGIRLQLGSRNIPSNLKRKFRIWRANIPRASYITKQHLTCGINTSVDYTISLQKDGENNGRNRIRNPWTYILLKRKNPGKSHFTLHDLMVYYYE